MTSELMELSRSTSQLIRFLQEELSLSSNSIAMAMRRREQDPGPLPMILWQYGLVTLEQLERIFDWLEG
ncbi:DUF2949 domain-containing protein [Leptolyngbya sp. FACHB-261]|uniref:DUF2949 domain-containing protein n=1 Tax=Leptolyngbya sp. FACHB-261 TaxID=2692806 RepID=UPI0016890481|nr:DUF2949 domain-containing protein [Leptolyngbya sp. FACHB-261]MBD2099399.1 DUF2949 domain-containing protein [Leptolyngbya sp. FACHB-261]